jgi:flagellar biosynthesis protein FlhG
LDPLEKLVDTMIVDIPAGASDNSLSFASAVDKLLIVLVGEPTSFMDAYTFIKAANIETGVRNFSVVVNMADNEAVATSNFEKFRRIVDKFLDVNINFAGYVPKSKKLQQSIVKRLPIVLNKEAELEIVSFQRLAKNVIKSGVNRNNGIRFFSGSKNK